jgi:hypothetical protein
MATSLNSILGDFRGSVNGVTGSRNSSKAFIRGRVKPTNPKSVAQRAARAAFRAAGKIFKTLTDEQRAQWGTFAKDGYNPLKKANKGNYTAAQVVTAIASSVASSNALFSVPTIEAFGAPGTMLSIGCSLMSVNVDAPQFSIAPSIQDTVLGPANMNVLGAYLESNGDCTIDIQFEGLAGTGLGQDKFLDPNGLKFGFGCYISTGTNYANQRPSTMLQSNLGFTGVVTTLTSTLTGKHGIRIVFNCSNQLARYKTFPVLNTWFLATPILVGENGTQTKLNTVPMQFGTAAPTLPT